MDFIRIGDKVISRTKIDKKVDELIKLRAMGLSQADVGEKMGIERTFISRLEGLGEIRKGQSIAAVGFPIKNKQEVEKILREYGVEYSLLMSEDERNDFVNQRNGQQFVNYILELINKFRDFDTVIVMASDNRNKIIKGMLDNQIIEIDIGKSPLKEDVNVNLDLLNEILMILKG
jgi:DNA-binding transcriptional regulator LsrR (DeoR family)